ncbi:MAG: hypothetical protein LC793_12985 [Thermomicrobia bacterium]|nr:hypothetical protein [Thermomicrobia bacterium]
MNRRAMIGSIIGIPVVVVVLVVLVFLGKQNLLPGQTQPTAIPVTPFANISNTAPAGTTIAASTETVAPAAATTAPTTAAAAASGSGDYGNSGSASGASATLPLPVTNRRPK